MAPKFPLRLSVSLCGLSVSRTIIRTVGVSRDCSVVSSRRGSMVFLGVVYSDDPDRRVLSLVCRAAGPLCLWSLFSCRHRGVYCRTSDPTMTRQDLARTWFLVFPLHDAVPTERPFLPRCRSYRDVRRSTCLNAALLFSTGWNTEHAIVKLANKPQPTSNG